MRKFTGIILTAAMLTSGAAFAQGAWPSKTISLIVPYAPGGYTDSVGRITAQFLEKELGQTVIVENRAGAGGIVGTDLVSKSQPDGYTLCMCSVGAVSVAPVAQAVEYDPLTAFSPISIVSEIPQTVIINPSLPVNTIEEFVAYAKEHPGELDYASSGAGGLMHFAVQLFQSKTGTELVHIPFGGGAPATAAVVSGEVDFTFTNMTDALPQIEADTVRGLAVTADERSPFLPDLPTIAETVVPGFTAVSWNGVLAPAGLSDDIVARLSDALKKMAEDEGVKEAMAKVGATPVFITPEQYAERISQEVAQWKATLEEIQ